MRRTIHRIARASGLHVERHRDPCRDLAVLLSDRPVRAVVDGGAHGGVISREFLRLFPEAEVHAFEPQPGLAADLRRAAAVSPRWHVHEAALSDRAGTAEFHVPRGVDYTASLLSPIGRLGERVCDTVGVTTVRLDEWALKAGVLPDVVKLDLQGAELPALRGAEMILPNVRAVLCEVNFVPRYDGCSDFADVTHFLARNGLRLCRLYEIHTGPGGRYEFADALYLRGMDG